MGVRAMLDERGRLCIPAEIRKELDFHEGDTVVVEPVRPGEFRVLRLANAIQQGRGIFRQLREDDESLVDELIRDRKEEAKREDAQG